MYGDSCAWSCQYLGWGSSSCFEIRSTVQRANRTTKTEDSSCMFPKLLLLVTYRYRPERVAEVAQAAMDEALMEPAREVYIREWLRNITNGLAVASDAELDQRRKGLGLTESEMSELLDNLDFGIWALLRMHRLLPLAPQIVQTIVPSCLQVKLHRSRSYLDELGQKAEAGASQAKGV